ncbi:MAG: hypothetical protein A2018_06420 [Alphaproteobacteria bacterium GWF2_58_20]|nr:MAG: hypothetical protein A2018_06420 [Alphaproteobacteria bacterium GWF2_58_20]
MKTLHFAKWLVAGIFLGVASLAAIGSLLLSQLDFEALRPKIVLMASEALGQPVTIGQLRGHVFPIPSVSLEDVLIGGADQEILSLKELDASFGLWRLLHGQFEVKRISGRDGEIHLDMTPEGQFTFLSKDGGAQDNAAFPEIEGISFRNVKVFLRVPGQKDVIFALDRVVGGFGREVRLATSGQLDMVPFRLDMVAGSLKTWQAGEDAWPVDLSAGMGSFSLNMRGSMPPVSQIRTPWKKDFSLMLDMQGPVPDVLRHLAVLPDLGDDVKVSGRVSAHNGRLEMSWQDIQLLGNSITGELSFAPDATPPHVSGRLDAQQVDMQTLLVLLAEKPSSGKTEKESGKVLPAEDVLSRLAAIDADFSVTAERLELPSGHAVENLAAALRIQNGKLSLSPFTVDFEGKVFAGTLAADLGGRDVPVRAMISEGARTLDIGGLMHYQDQTWTASGISAQLGSSDMSGDVSLDLSAALPRLEVHLSGKYLDLADFLFAENTTKSVENEMMDASLFPERDMPSLPELSAALSGAFDSVKVHGVVLQNAVLQGHMDPARVQVDKLGFEVFSAPVQMSGDMVQEDGAARVSLSGRGKGIDYGRLFKETGVSDLVTGKADVSFDVSGMGRNWPEFIKSLKGKASFVGGAGEIANGQLDLWASDLVIAMLPKFSKEAKDMTRVNCTVALWDVDQGQANLSDFLFDTGKITVRGAGVVDLVTQSVDIHLLPEPKGASFVSMAPPVHITGAWQDPKVDVETAGSVFKGAALAGAALGLINPVGVLAILVKKGTGEKNPCTPYLETPKE